MRLCVAALFVLTACVGTNADDLPVNPESYPDKGRTAVGPVERGVLMLTFDDGPSPLYTRDIMTVLASHHAPATFFVIGKNIPGNRDLLAEEQARGFQIGNHTYYHEVQPALTEAEFKQRLGAVKVNIGDHDNDRLLFRFPYGAAGDDQLRWLSEVDFAGNHYKAVGWNLDSQDWDFGATYPEAPFSQYVLDDGPTCGPDANPFQHDYVGWTQYIARKTKGGVMLFHDIQEITHDNLDAVLTYFEDPARYWGELSPATASLYQRYYACTKVDGTLAFHFAAVP
jgi:peptidoglycan/xylan/chitin deacetylase (PgdA/CDA1 family)